MGPVPFDTSCFYPPVNRPVNRPIYRLVGPLLKRDEEPFWNLFTWAHLDAAAYLIASNKMNQINEICVFLGLNYVM